MAKTFDELHDEVSAGWDADTWDVYETWSRRLAEIVTHAKRIEPAKTSVDK